MVHVDDGHGEAEEKSVGIKVSETEQHN